MKHQLNLGEIITLLKNCESDETEVYFDFARFVPCELTSYRGYYEQLAFVWDVRVDAPTVADVIRMCEETIGKDLHGYKGGEYTMGLHTPLWVARHNDCHGTAVVGVRDFGFKVIIETQCIE